MEVEFKYDIAFSLLAQDLELAEEIKRKINGDIKCFLYSDEQKALAGKNGIEEFKNVFKIESRLAVILFRRGWGGTGWTGIEEDAMQDRLIKDGEGFVFLVLIDDKHDIPIWIPTSKIWGDFKRLGIDGLISVLEERVRERGKILTIETAEEKLKRIEKELEIKSKIRAILNGVDGKAYQMSEDEFEILGKTLNEKTDTLNSNKTKPLFIIENKANEILIRFKGYLLNFYWDIYSSNSLSDAKLIIRMQKRIYKRGAVRAEYFEFERHEFVFNIDMNFINGWTCKRDEKFYTTKNLVDKFIQKLLDLFERDVNNIKTFSD
jgi:hypothetical protein